MPLPTPTLQTARLLLRPFAESDAEAIYALQSSSRPPLLGLSSLDGAQSSRRIHCSVPQDGRGRERREIRHRDS